ncbi:hypothetical protein [Paracoccus sp. NSM]|uniref:hypothetical protein n=1 Tax=Paracoccus sp. NSM TaxID=3457784 RepID=UPI004035A478
MAQSPQFKIFRPGGEYVAACKYAEDAAALTAILGDGTKIKHGHSHVVWTEGAEDFSAGESYDRVAKIVHDRIRQKGEDYLRRVGRL